MFRQSPGSPQAARHRAVSRPLFVWLPVALGIGISVYFVLKTEPSALLRVLVLILMLATASLVPLTGRKLPWAWRAPLLGLATLLAGFTLAAWRAHDVAAPVLSFRYYGPIEGRIVAIDRSRSGAMRLTLDQIGLEDVSSWRTPDRVRVSLHGDQGNVKPEPGQFVAMTGHLSPPGGPSEPGGFDFRRFAWFQSLGAVGYTRKPIALLTPPISTGWRIWLYTLRLSLSNAISSRIEGPEGGFAAAILTGDRAGLDPDHVRNLRHSNLAHLLAISGLHMGLLTGAVFFALRAAFAIVPMIALTYPIKKFAALGALIAAFSYLHLSGASVATERAFIMASLMFVAICLDRRAISLRTVAWAALVVMLMRPEAVMGVGFQMSFAATTALVVVFNLLRDGAWQRIPGWARGAAGVALSSAVAGLATAPFAAATFNIYSSYGLVANLAAVPVMGLIVMPGALAALVLAPFGAEGLGLWAMEQGIAWILFVAGWVSGLEGAVRPIIAPHPVVLPLIVAGGLWACLEPTRLRLLGGVPVLCALVIWTHSSRPEVLVSPSGGLIGVMTAEGRMVSKERGERFSAENWLENDGDLREQAVSYALPGFLHSRARTDLPEDLIGLHLVQLRGKSAPEDAPFLCANGTILISTKALPDLSGPCDVYDLHRLRRTGALAITQENGAWQVRTSAEASGRRLWTGYDPARQVQ